MCRMGRHSAELHDIFGIVKLLSTLPGSLELYLRTLLNTGELVITANAYYRRVQINRIEENAYVVVLSDSEGGGE